VIFFGFDVFSMETEYKTKVSKGKKVIFLCENVCCWWWSWWCI